MEAYNDYVIIIRDTTETEKGGLTLPPGCREKPHVGTILSVGSCVTDEKLKQATGTKCLFHKGVGQEIDYDGQIFLFLHGHEVIGKP